MYGYNFTVMIKFFICIKLTKEFSIGSIMQYSCSSVSSSVCNCPNTDIIRHNYCYLHLQYYNIIQSRQVLNLPKTLFLSCFVVDLYYRHHVSASITIYADLPGHHSNDNPQGTIPLNMSVTPCRPDVVLKLNERKLHILELTICSNTQRGFEEARQRKTNKTSYCHLITDLERRGVEVRYATLEIGSLGHHQHLAAKALQTTLPELSRSYSTSILDNLGKVAIACSYHIFQARNCVSWPDHKPFYTL